MSGLGSCSNLILLGVFSLASAATNSASFSIVNYPGSLTTSARGISNNGEIVGFYEFGTGGRRGFLSSGGTYTPVSPPGATRSSAEAINNKGQVAGAYTRGAGESGFLFSRGSYAEVRFPGAIETHPYGINDVGQVVGSYNTGTETRGFLYSGGVYQTISYPGSGQTVAAGINNDGQIVGWYDSPGEADRGFLFTGGRYTTVSVPESLSTNAGGINSTGQIVGVYRSASTSRGCFVLTARSYVIFDLVDATPQSCEAINDHGQVAGTFSYGEAAAAFGYVATPPGVPIRAGVLSHIATGGGWDTTITLINTSSTQAEATVRFFAGDGSALQLPLEVTQKGSTQPFRGSRLERVMDPNTSLLIVTHELATTVTGWAEVTSTGPLGGFAIFRQHGGGPSSEGTVPLQTRFPSTMTLPYDNNSGFVMGVALANLVSESAVITAIIWDEEGTMLGTQNIPVAGSGHTSFVLPAEILLTSGKRGIVQFRTTGNRGVAGLGLRFSPLMTFTSVPPM
jgi:probable HAF family extracellular repeat protein